MLLVTTFRKYLLYKYFIFLRFVPNSLKGKGGVELIYSPNHERRRDCQSQEGNQILDSVNGEASPSLLTMRRELDIESQNEDIDPISNGSGESSSLNAKSKSKNQTPTNQKMNGT